MNKVFSFIALAFLGCGTVSAQQVNASGVLRPKLVVGIVVDQMRWDYLYRYQKRYGEGGFKRLLNEGFSCENTRIERYLSEKWSTLYPKNTYIESTEDENEYEDGIRKGVKATLPLNLPALYKKYGYSIIRKTPFDNSLTIDLAKAAIDGEQLGVDEETDHGEWNPYDTHIPLVFMGWGIQHGATTRQTFMTDIVPTIAALLHVQAPNGCVGQPIF